MAKNDTYVNRYRADTGEFVERVKITPPLLMNLAKCNRMNAAQCSQALERGETVYTSFSYYKIGPRE